MSNHDNNLSQHRVAPLSKVLRAVMLGSVVSLSSLLVACGGSGSQDSGSMETQTDSTDTAASQPDNNDSTAVTVAPQQPTVIDFTDSVNDSNDTVTSQQFTDLVLALTDAEEDFVSYTIDVTSILLTRSNGDQVEVLPQTTEVDFVEYQELSELFALVRAPIGVYESITMQLDYTNAYILVQDEDGDTFEAQVVDGDNNLITTHNVEFRLAEGNELDLREGRPAHLTLDLDLSSSNTILSYEPAVVQVEAFVIGDVAIDEEREHRMRGTLSEVDTDAQSVTLNIRPMRKKQGEFGEFTVQFNDETAIEVDGEVLALVEALSTLEEQDEHYPLVAFGKMVTDDATGEVVFTATEVLAGSSVPWTGKDGFRGMVTQLESGVSYVTGLTVDTDAKERSYITDVPLILSDETSFTARLNDELDASYLVPGQRLRALGQYTEADAEAAIIESFDISGEAVQILLSTALGQVTEVTDTGVATISVDRFNKRPSKLIKRRQRQHDGQPDTPEQNFDLETLVVDISEFSQVTVEEQDWIKVVGYMNPEANDTDMDADKLVKMNVSDTILKYAAGYGQEGTTPTVADDNTSLTLDVTEGRHKLNFRFNPVNMMPEVDTFTFVAAAEVNKFALAERGEESLFYDNMEALLAELKVRLSVNATVASIKASGTLNDDSTQLIVTDLVIKLN